MSLAHPQLRSLSRDTTPKSFALVRSFTRRLHRELDQDNPVLRRFAQSLLDTIKEDGSQDATS